MNPSITPLILALLFSSHVVLAALPQVDFERMGNVGLAGAFAGLDIFSNTTVSFDPNTSTLLSRSKDGALTRVASTNNGGSILAGCALKDVFYLAGSFSQINDVTVANIASYNPSTRAVLPLGSNGPNGEIHAVFCDSKENKLWVGGKFSSPGGSIAIFDPKANSWSGAPFGGVSGGEALVNSISTNSSGSSLFFSGSFMTAFGTGSAALNGTNNPNVPFSVGATPFSSSLVPVPLQNVQVDGSPSTTQAGFSDIKNILCPSGGDGSGNSWYAADASTPLITVRTFSSISANGVRLGNTFQPDHGTTSFTVTTIPDNTVRTVKYLDPTTGQNVTCSNTCPLSTDSSVLYQDFLFDQPLSITGVQIKLTSFTGSSPGLHILQLLSSGAFASAINDENRQSCFAPNPSNSTQTGSWQPKQAITDIAGTTQEVLISTVNVGTPSSSGPTFTWMPYVSAAGNYDINLLVPGCAEFQDCASRTSVKITVFPGSNLNPQVKEISQQNTADQSYNIYSGPILPSTTNFVTTISMALADNPAGTGQDGKYILVADRVQFILKSADINATADASGSAGGSISNIAGLARGFGFLEWPRTSTAIVSGVDGRKSLPNNTLTALDDVGFEILSGMGGASGASSANTGLNAVAHHPVGVFVGGSFSLGSGSASGSSNIVAYKSGALAQVANGGLNGAVNSLVLYGDQLFVGGAFKDTPSGSTQGALQGIALYNVQKNSWSALGAGVNGEVTSLGLLNNQVQVAGNFTKILSSPNSNDGSDTSGFAVWDIKSASWVNNGGFIVGKMTFIGNGTSDGQFIAGNVQASQQFGATGLVMLKNGNENGPAVTPLPVGLGAQVTTQSPNSSTVQRRSASPSSFGTLSSHIRFHANIFGRQTAPTTSQTSTLPPALAAAAPAVLAGAFWTNSSTSKEVVIFGGNFSFTAAGSSTPSQGIAIYNPQTQTASGLPGPQVQGTVRTLLVDSNSLYVGGEFTISGASINGLALYDLAKGAWDLTGLQTLQASSGSKVVVRSITRSSAKANTVIVAGSFAQAGSLGCAGICSFDTSNKQWNALGSGIHGEVTSVAYAGNNQDVLIAGGSITLSDNTASNVAQYSISNNTWLAVGSGSDIPGPVSAVEVNNHNASSVFAAGRANDGTSFLSFWNGAKWENLGSTFSQGTNVADLKMVPLSNTHPANDIIESDRVLMISGSLSTSGGNSSSALFDGQNIIPYIVSTSSTGTAGSVSSLFHSFASFSFNQRKFLATGVVILISIAIAAGVVFLLALIGILWTLFSRKDDKLAKFDSGEEDDDSALHRPSSLLEHINAATLTTILPAGAYSHDREEEKATTASRSDQDPFGPDGSNYLRAETPSDAMGGMLAEETSRPAHARYSFDGTGEGELPLSAGAEVEVLDDRDPAWWYARDMRTGQEGVVPAAYLY
ncbi:cortical protein marker for cell polarity-domain-containing protein [Crepidotus variabilis]|uniref:Cortical protein marker for cell polarity-domain-containing protein n=1 Tax=Crepidotus variabilis TaxID=179855 RepID=A0A9P6EGT0_9AGAR|nr:cortical protein marker for cell polarity-domain-containing protein [Crepidotus variabilis]